ncbi:MAG: glycosyltransferase family 2 protein, partial [Nitrososphaeria archaeon]|nr:glycosyltransferase family 2 protein [Nitrososphaeria archaeon]
MELDKKDDSPKVSVLLLNWNGRCLLGDLLDKAIKSVLNQTYKNIEIIFIDNGSTDDSIEYVTKSYGNKVKIIKLSNNMGFCVANNLGVNFSSTDSQYVMFMNSDVVLSRNYIEGLISFMEQDKMIGAIQGLEISSNGTPIIGGLMDSLLGRPFTINICPKFPLKVLWVAFTVCIVDKELFLNLGGFSRELFMYHDDVDFCIRMLAYGRKSVALPYVTYFHKRGGIVRN